MSCNYRRAGCCSLVHGRKPSWYLVCAFTFVRFLNFRSTCVRNKKRIFQPMKLSSKPWSFVLCRGFWLFYIKAPQIYKLVDDGEFERATMLLMAIFHIMEDSIKKDKISPCPFYPNQCKSIQGKYCISNPLWAPISNSSGCVMAYAAFTLCAHKKGVSPFTLQETAYFNWLSRGRPNGDDWRDWFQAEQEVSEV